MTLLSLFSSSALYIVLLAPALILSGVSAEEGSVRGSASSDRKLASSIAAEDQYLGCFRENWTDRVYARDMGWLYTPDGCIRDCANEGYSYAGLMTGGNCRCGNRQASAHSSNCNVACSVDQSQLCGGYAEFMSYSTGVQASDNNGLDDSTGWNNGGGAIAFPEQYLGCYRETWPTRVYQADLGWLYTVEGCINDCTNEGYAYAGLMSGGNCRCGNRQGTSSSSNCNARCTQDSSTLCGGYQEFMSYSTGTLSGSSSGGARVTAAPVEPEPTATPTASPSEAPHPTESPTSHPTETPAKIALQDQYLGCFSETWPSRVYDADFGWLYTVQDCVDTCASDGYIYAGLMTGGNCRCGNKQGSATSTNCNTRCTENRDELCGGNQEFMSYSTGVSESVSNSGSDEAVSDTDRSGSSSNNDLPDSGSVMTSGLPEASIALPDKYLGCFRENWPRRVYDTDIGWLFTVEDCIQSCANDGFAYAGLMTGGNCRCGNTQGTAKSSNCNAPCSQNRSELCGGYQEFMSYVAKGGST